MGLIKKESTSVPTAENVNNTSKEIKYLTVREETPYYVRNGYGKPMSQYEIDTDKRIGVAGIVQAAMQSPGLVGIPYTTVKELANNTKEYADEMIAYVKEKLGE